MKSRQPLTYLSTLVLLVLGGCASYVTPGGPVDLAAIRSPEIRDLMSRDAAASFPARIAFARVQSPGYRSGSATTFGSGAFSIVTTREFMQDKEIESLKAWPALAAIAPLNRLLLPSNLESLDDLRTAAASLKADIVLIFTIDTSFRVDGRNIGPLSVISLGLLRDRETIVTSTASAIFVDVRTGFVYGAAEATQSEKKTTSAWGTVNAVDQGRLITERAAFEGLRLEMAETWTAIVDEHASEKQ